MKKNLVFGALAMALVFNWAKAMELNVEIIDSRLRVSLQNTTDKVALVDKRLALGGTDNWNELILIIADQAGTEIPFSCKIQLGPPSEQDKIYLRPGEFTGRCYTIKELVRCYGLTTGVYKLKAKYSGKLKDKDAFSATLESSGTVDLVVSEN